MALKWSCSGCKEEYEDDVLKCGLCGKRKPRKSSRNVSKADNSDSVLGLHEFRKIFPHLPEELTFYVPSTVRKSSALSGTYSMSSVRGGRCCYVHQMDKKSEVYWCADSKQWCISRGGSIIAWNKVDVEHPGIIKEDWNAELRGQIIPVSINVKTIGHANKRKKKFQRKSGNTEGIPKGKQVKATTKKSNLPKKSQKQRTTKISDLGQDKEKKNRKQALPKEKPVEKFKNYREIVQYMIDNIPMSDVSSSDSSDEAKAEIQHRTQEVEKSKTILKGKKRKKSSPKNTQSSSSMEEEYIPESSSEDYIDSQSKKAEEEKASKKRKKRNLKKKQTSASDMGSKEAFKAKVEESTLKATTKGKKRKKIEPKTLQKPRESNKRVRKGDIDGAGKIIAKSEKSRTNIEENNVAFPERRDQKRRKKSMITPTRPVASMEEDRSKMRLKAIRPLLGWWLIVYSTKYMAYYGFQSDGTVKIAPGHTSKNPNVHGWGGDAILEVKDDKNFTIRPKDDSILSSEDITVERTMAGRISSLTIHHQNKDYEVKAKGTFVCQLNDMERMPAPARYVMIEATCKNSKTRAHSGQNLKASAPLFPPTLQSPDTISPMQNNLQRKVPIARNKYAFQDMLRVYLKIPRRRGQNPKELFDAINEDMKKFGNVVDMYLSKFCDYALVYYAEEKSVEEALQARYTVIKGVEVSINPGKDNKPRCKNQQRREYVPRTPRFHRADKPPSVYEITSDKYVKSQIFSNDGMILLEGLERKIDHDELARLLQDVGAHEVYVQWVPDSHEKAWIRLLPASAAFDAYHYFQNKKTDLGNISVLIPPTPGDACEAYYLSQWHNGTIRDSRRSACMNFVEFRIELNGDTRTSYLIKHEKIKNIRMS